ncbi:unnamed protein product [Aphanomyces euteiches]|uniref:Uncharacterized protein n=1 Tax=Aphanomyces euteiches TaxID=100861 RepID=A0A6G0XHJ1_9STRA|nr:hypothetical protein Ae201684_004778 [Aphanomyces euteiches]KAH9073188.1 hypothetical protein Ae201684P_015005 [Aphanomyces euteiches]
MSNRILQEVSDHGIVADPQYGKVCRDVIVHHDATFQDVHDHHDAADPQDATRYGTDCRDVIDLNRAADLLDADDLAANHGDDLHQMDDLAANQDDDLQHGHDLVVGHREDDLRPADDLAVGLQDVIPTKITHLSVE